ncbi:MAG TPA: hypothetical protein VKU36_02510 [Candidatus Babeliales bacterium]|nr:hypothetical protein [Candidatus Babeliales bacterium]
MLIKMVLEVATDNNAAYMHKSKGTIVAPIKKNCPTSQTSNRRTKITKSMECLVSLR